MGARWPVALALLSLAGSANAVTVLEYRGALQGDPPLVRPVTVSVDPSTMAICVTDEASHCLDVFDESGFHRFRTDATSSIRLPDGGVIDANGDFLFTDTALGKPGEPIGGRTIRRLNFLGEPMEFAPTRPFPGWEPHHLLLARNGDIVTIDRAGLMARHDDAGTLLWTAQVAEAEWEGVELLGVPAERADGTLLVPGASLRRVIRISADGQEKSAFGVPGTKRGELAFPVGVAVTPDGQTLVLDRMRHLILA
jgi:DNA-binding beta-propeller fold protein YncE